MFPSPAVNHAAQLTTPAQPGLGPYSGLTRVLGIWGGAETINCAPFPVGGRPCAPTGATPTESKMLGDEVTMSK